MTDLARRLLLPLLCCLLVACWLGGGVTADDTSIDELLQLLALPVLLVGVLVMTADGASLPVRAGVVVALLIVLVPVLQQLPLPQAVWGAVPARQALAADLAQAGVSVQPHWSLAPAATRKGLLALLPALAAFLAAASLDVRQRRSLARLVVGLALANVLFAFFQAGLPRDSGLRLYQDFDAGFGGVFANTNHQATACVIAMVMAIGLGTEARLRARLGEGHPHREWWYFALAGFFLLMVPLSTSRAGMIIAFPALALALVASDALPLRRVWRSRRTLMAALVVLVLAVVGVRGAIGWMAVDQAEELRHVMAGTAVAIGKAEAPLGSGVGSFIPAFEQASPLQLRLANYVNHAHNEYAQWWMTSGVLGLLVLALALALLAVVGWRIARSEGRNRALAGASLAALCAVLAHSWVDYPLRTLTLMATSGALAGLMLAAAGEAHARQRRRRRAQGEALPDAASGGYPAP